MHMTDQEKAKIGGRLARIFNLKLDPESGRYMLGEGYLTKTAIGVFEVVHDVAIHKDYCEAVNGAATALIVAESLLMEAPIRKEEIEARDIGDVLDAAHEFVHWFHNKKGTN